MFGLSKPLMTILAAGAAVILLLGMLQIRSCQQARQQAAQSRVDQGQQGALRESAGEAVNTVGDVAGNQAASEDLTRRNTEEIHHAQGADTRLDPELDAAFVRAACRRASAAHDPKCRVQQPHP